MAGVLTGCGRDWQRKNGGTGRVWKNTRIAVARRFETPPSRALWYRTVLRRRGSLPVPRCWQPRRLPAPPLAGCHSSHGRQNSRHSCRYPAAALRAYFRLWTDARTFCREGKRTRAYLPPRCQNCSVNRLPPHSSCGLVRRVAASMAAHAHSAH